MTDFPPNEDNLENPAEMEGETGAGEPEKGQGDIELIDSQKVAWLQAVAFTVTRLLIILVTLVVIILALLAKVAWWIIILRAGVTILLLGFLSFAFNWFLGKYLIEAKLAELKEKKEIEDAERILREQAELEALALLQQEEDEIGDLNIELGMDDRGRADEN
ncbi:MAG: hypothetical protein LWX83_05560 [Anaerolineae bacterium]|nr:hypothetical protein [Anaerolineae bacterium]